MSKPNAYLLRVVRASIHSALHSLGTGGHSFPDCLFIVYLTCGPGPPLHHRYGVANPQLAAKLNLEKMYRRHAKIEAGPSTAFTSTSSSFQLNSSTFEVLSGFTESVSNLT